MTPCLFSRFLPFYAYMYKNKQEVQIMFIGLFFTCVHISYSFTKVQKYANLIDLNVNMKNSLIFDMANYSLNRLEYKYSGNRKTERYLKL